MHAHTYTSPCFPSPSNSSSVCVSQLILQVVLRSGSSTSWLGMEHVPSLKQPGLLEGPSLFLPKWGITPNAKGLPEPQFSPASHRDWLIYCLSVEFQMLDPIPLPWHCSSQTASAPNLIAHESICPIVYPLVAIRLLGIKTPPCGNCFPHLKCLFKNGEFTFNYFSSLKISLITYSVLTTSVRSRSPLLSKDCSHFSFSSVFLSCIIYIAKFSSCSLCEPLVQCFKQSLFSFLRVHDRNTLPHPLWGWTCPFGLFFFSGQCNFKSQYTSP